MLPNIHWGMPQPWFSVWENNHDMIHITIFENKTKKVFFRDCNCEPVGMGRTQNLHPDGRTFTLTHPFFGLYHYWAPTNHAKKSPHYTPQRWQPPLTVAFGGLAHPRGLRMSRLATMWLFRASDIAHSAKPWPIHRTWSMRVVQVNALGPSCCWRVFRWPHR